MAEADDGLFLIDGEDAGSTPWEFDSISEAGSMTLALDSNNPNNGTYAYRVTFDGSSEQAYGTVSFSPNVDEIYLRFYLYVPSTTTGGNWQNAYIVRMLDNSPFAALVQFYIRTGGDGAFYSWGWIIDQGGSSTSTTNFSTDEWHYVEIHWVSDASVGGATIKVDGDTLVADEDQDTSANDLNNIRIGIDPNGSFTGGNGHTLDFDDIKAADDDWVGAYSAAGGGATLTMDAIAHALNLEAPTLTQRHGLTVAAHDYAVAFDNVTLSVAAVVELVVASLDHTLSIETPGITQGHNLTVDEIAHTLGIEAVDLSQRHQLVVDALAQAIGIDNIDLVTKGVLSVDDILHSVSMDAFGLTGRHTLAGLGALDFAVSFGEPGLTNAILLSVDDLSQTYTVDGVALTQAHVLQVDELGHTVDLGTIALSQAQLLVVQEMLQSLSVDRINFSRHSGSITISFSGDAVTLGFSASAPKITFTGG